MSEIIIECSVSLVNVHGRFRKDFGDIEGLAKSIREIGLLQPIGIDSAYRLVFGERRLRAYLHMGRTVIPARFVNLDSLMKGELAENEFRKDFTPSERVAIGEAIEHELESRHGGDRKTQDQVGKNSHLIDEPGRTRDIAAKAAGFGNGKTYEQAKKVANEAAPELVQAMDEGRASVSAAAALLDLPKDQQAVAAKGDKPTIQKAAKAAKAAKKAPADPVEPQATAHVLQIINTMDLLARYALRSDITATQLANKFLDEVDMKNPVIAERLAAIHPFMLALGQIAAEFDEVAK